MYKILMGASLLAASLSAQAVETAVGLTVSTFGPGVEVTFGINENISIRGHFSSFSIDMNDYVDDLDAFETQTTSASADFDLGAVGILFDYHPFGGKFRISTGLLQNNNELKAKASVVNEPIGSATTASCGTPGNCYTGDLTLGIDLGGTVPYFGVGFGSAASEGSPIGFGFDIGVVPMNVDVQYQLLNNQVGAVAQVSAIAIQQEVAEIQKDADDFKLFPFINLTASYRF